MLEAEVIKDLLADNWNADNTSSHTPVIKLITSIKNPDARQSDFVLCMNSGDGTSDHVGTQAYTYQTRVSIDIRSTLWTRFKLDIAEVLRIMEGKSLSPGGVYNRIIVLGMGVDLSDKTRQLYRRVIDVYLVEDIKELTAI